MTYQTYSQIPNTIYDPVSIYIGETGTYSPVSGWYVWRKPENISMVYIAAIGGGGGGGGGGSRDYGLGAVGGGGGGSPGSSTILFIPAVILPEYLYIFPGRGGQGGTGEINPSSTGTNGEDGGDTYVCINSDTNVYNRLCFGLGGRGGYAGASGVGGSAGRTGINTSVTNLVPLFSLAGQSLNRMTYQLSGGRGGGSNGAGDSSNWGNLYSMTFNGPGAGGGGITAAGITGAIAAPGNAAQSIGYTINGVNTIFNAQTGVGSSGRSSNTPDNVLAGGNGFGYSFTSITNPSTSLIFFNRPISCGGGGGGSLAGYTGNGANGGAGGIGSGGGGGGATLGGVGYSGGKGGNGGPGFVVIATM